MEFRTNEAMGDESSKECLQRRVKMLEEYLAAPNETINDIISKTKLELSSKFTIRIFEQVVYLRRALQDAIDLK